MGQRSLESVSVDWGRSVLRPHRSRKLAALARGRPPIGTRLVTALGTVSALYQPIWKGGEAIGVPVVTWRRRVEAMSDRGGAVVGLLAAEAGVASSEPTCSCKRRSSLAPTR